MINLVFAALVAMASSTSVVKPCVDCGVLQLQFSTKKLAQRGNVEVLLTQKSGEVRKATVPRGRSEARIELPRGAYDLVVQGPRAIRIRRQIVLGEATVKMAFTLEPLPKLTGTVLARTTRQPVAGALVDAGSEPAITDAAGRFELDLDPELWPARIRVRATPFAETSVPIPSARVSTSLPEIYVTRGGTVTVEVDQQREGEVVELELREIQRTEMAGGVLGTRPVPSAIQANTFLFENVAPGRYLVLAKGNQELERFGIVVEVSEGQDVSASVLISPFTLDVRTKMEGENLPNAEIALTHFDGRWEGTLHTDGEGIARVKLWQGGKVRSMVDAPGLTAPYIERHRIGSGDDEWVLDIDALEIEGVVVDAESGTPIPRARVRLHVDARDSFSLASSTGADSEGRFRFRPVHHGEHQLRVFAAAYQPLELSYLFLEPQRNRELVIRLDRASTVQLKLLDAAGAPVPLATALHLQDGIPMRGRTDASGMLRVPIATDRPTELHIIPADGSFTVTTLNPETREAVVRVPPAVGRLVVRTETTGGDPIPNVSVLVRYNGRVLPPDVLHALAQTNGGAVRSDVDGRMVFNRMPAGLYELWPAASDQELRSLAAGPGREPAVRIAVAPGDNVAIMTFEPVTQR